MEVQHKPYLIFNELVSNLAFFLRSTLILNIEKDPEVTADLVTFTEEILNGKLHFLRSDSKFQYNGFADTLSFLLRKIKIIYSI